MGGTRVGGTRVGGTRVGRHEHLESHEHLEGAVGGHREDQGEHSRKGSPVDQDRHGDSDDRIQSPTWPRGQFVPAHGAAAGYVRRVRRLADLNQRELADRVGLSQSTVSAIEAGHRPISVDVWDRVLAVAGLRLAVVDREGREIAPMSPDGARDRAGRRFGAHLDVSVMDGEGWPVHWGAGPRWDRPRNPVDVPTRARRDAKRALHGIPVDHATARDADARFAQLSRQRAERADRELATRAHRPVVAPCECPTECYGSSSCVDVCQCQCGG